MNKVYLIIAVILFLVLSFFTALFYGKEFRRSDEKVPIVKAMARVGVFASIATILYVVPGLQFNIPIFPSFLKFHFDEIPALIAGFAFGPFSSFGIIVIKTLIKLPLGGSETMFVGEISDLIYSCALVLPAAFIYQKHRKFKFAALGLGIGFVLELIVSLLLNIYVMIPAYMYFFGMDESALLRMFPPFITNATWGYGLMAVLPFNAIKNTVVVAVTLLIYKPLHRLIEKIHA